MASFIATMHMLTQFHENQSKPVFCVYAGIACFRLYVNKI